MTANLLPLARLHLTVRAEGPLQLPPYAGSMLRGAFGHALLALSPLPHTDGKPCALHASCPYCQLFAAPPLPGHSLQKFSHMPQPYVIEPPAWGERTLEVGETLDFCVVLCGRGLRELPLVTLALRQALQAGVGPGDGRAELLAVCLETPEGEQLVHDPADGQFAAHSPVVPAPVLAAAEGVTLRFITPLRLQENGRALPPERLTPRALLMAVVRRAALMADVHGGCAPAWDFQQLGRLAMEVRDTRQLHWQDWTRRSARQKCTMTLGGVCGEWTLQGELGPFLPALHLGQWLHVGKETVFGMGQYRLEIA